MAGNCPNSLLSFALDSLVKLSHGTLEKLYADDYVSYCNRLNRIPSKRKRRNSDSMDNSCIEAGLFHKRKKLEDSGTYTDGKSCQDDVQEILITKEIVKINCLRDDTFQNNIRDPVILLRIYLKCLPSVLWDRFTELLLKLFSEQTQDVQQRLRMLAYELLFCSKLSRFSSELNRVQETDMSFLFERLAYCTNLKSFEYSVPELDMDGSKFQDIFLQAICKLRKLRSFSYIPNRELLRLAPKVFPVLISFLNLKQLTIYYDASAMTDDTSSIRCLTECRHLENISLYSYGKGSEAENLTELLKNLENLYYLYHRELPNALMKIFSDNLRLQIMSKLKLQSLVLVAPKRNFGSQLIYIPCSALEEIAMLCPYLCALTIVKPPNLMRPLQHMPKLRALTLHDCDFVESLGDALETGKLQNLFVLRLINTEVAINYGDIVKLSQSCPRIEELEICNSNFVSSSGFTSDNVSCPLFPFLRKLVLLSLEIYKNEEPYMLITPSQWTVGSTLSKLLLQGSKLLEVLYIEFTPARDVLTDSVSSHQLLSYLTNCPHLKDLLLCYGPEINMSFMKTLFETCPNLRSLRKLHLWNFVSKQEEKEIRRRFCSLLT